MSALMGGITKASLHFELPDGTQYDAKIDPVLQVLSESL
jgi:hypothetical protein